jgi:uncharacterized membrane protein (DUF2068 family)
VLPAARARRLAPALAHLVAVTADGRRLCRCLRCDAWIEAPLPEAPDIELSDLAPEQVPRRGRELRDAIVLRLIAVERGVHSIAFGLAAVGLAVLRADLTGLQAQARTLTRDGMGGFAGPGQTASQSSLARDLERLLSLRRGTLGVLLVFALVYCVVEGVEAVGLWRERRWAEYLTAIATAGFLPFELRELARRVSIVRVGALVVNLAILVYLVWRKHLFGIGRRDGQAERRNRRRGEGRASTTPGTLPG